MNAESKLHERLFVLMDSVQEIVGSPPDELGVDRDTIVSYMNGFIYFFFHFFFILLFPASLFLCVVLCVCVCVLCCTVWKTQKKKGMFFNFYFFIQVSGRGGGGRWEKPFLFIVFKC